MKDIAEALLRINEPMDWRLARRRRDTLRENHTREVVVDMGRVEALERDVAEIKAALMSLDTQGKGGGDLIAPVVSDILDRMGALETLVVESLETPEALAAQLRLTAELMDAMDRQSKANREADLRVIEMHRHAGEQAAQAQGGLATVVESMRVDMEALTVAVEQLRNQVNRREGYVSGILRGRRTA